MKRADQVGELVDLVIQVHIIVRVGVEVTKKT